MSANPLQSVDTATTVRVRELASVKDAHPRRQCRDWNGTEPWACCDCD